jgi:hypothetical protein
MMLGEVKKIAKNLDWFFFAAPFLVTQLPKYLGNFNTMLVE